MGMVVGIAHASMQVIMSTQINFGKRDFFPGTRQALSTWHCIGYCETESIAILCSRQRLHYNYSSIFILPMNIKK
jgi:hypothetical protein